MFTNQDKENQKNKFYGQKNFSKFNPHFNPNYKGDRNKDFKETGTKENMNEPKEEKKEFKKPQYSEKENEDTRKQKPQDFKKDEEVKEKNSKPEGEEKKEQNDFSQPKRPDKCVLSCEEYLKLKYQLAEMINKYKQLDGEFENYRKRTREEIKDATTKGKIQAIELILPALDSFKKAKRIVKDEKNLEGINLIEKSLMQALEKQGVKKIDCVGKEFDTDFHNAVAIVEDVTKKPNIVLEEIEAGYTIGDKVVKFSQVVVNKKDE